MLTTAQRESFARNGFLVLRDAVDADLVRDARFAVEDDDSMGPGNQNEPSEEPFRSLNRQLYEYAVDLIGDDLPAPGDPSFGAHTDEEVRVGLHYPEDLPSLADPRAQRDAREALGVHLDNQTNPEGGILGLGVATYYDRVEPRDAGFTVWPGSHWMAAEHCELYRLEEPPVKHARVAEDSEFEDDEAFFDLFEPFEVTGDPGTVTLWHGGLVHSAGMQLAPGSLRMAGFTRFYLDPDAGDPDRLFAEPFRGWDGVDAGRP